MLYAIATLIILILDQSVKYWTVSNIELGTGVRAFLPKIVQLVYVRNTGAAFSLFQNGRWVFLILAAGFAALVIYALAKGVIRSGFGRWMAAFALAGALGNAIDRALYGYVVDMFDLLFMNFPVFNVADAFINIGAIGFCLYVLTSRHPFVEDGELKTEDALPEAPSDSPAAPASPANKLTWREKLSALAVARKAEKQARERSAAPVGIETITRESLKARFTPADPNRPFAEWEKDNPSPISVQEIRSKAEAPPAPEPPVEPARDQRVEPRDPVRDQRVREPEEPARDTEPRFREPVEILLPEAEAISTLLPDFSFLEEFEVDLSGVSGEDEGEDYKLEDILREFTDP